MLESTTRSVLVQTRDLKHAVSERGAQLRVVTVLPSRLERSMLRLLVESSDGDASECGSAVEFAFRCEGEAAAVV